MHCLPGRVRRLDQLVVELCVGTGAVQDGSGGEQPGPCQLPLRNLLLVVQQVGHAGHVADGGDPVAQVGGQVRLVPYVYVAVDQSRYQGAAIAVDVPGICRQVQFAGGRHGRDDAVIDNHALVASQLRVGTRQVQDIDVGQRHGLCCKVRLPEKKQAQACSPVSGADSCHGDAPVVWPSFGLTFSPAPASGSNS